MFKLLNDSKCIPQTAPYGQYGLLYYIRSGNVNVRQCYWKYTHQKHNHFAFRSLVLFFNAYLRPDHRKTHHIFHTWPVPPPTDDDTEDKAGEDNTKQDLFSPTAPHDTHALVTGITILIWSTCVVCVPLCMVCKQCLRVISTCTCVSSTCVKLLNRHNLYSKTSQDSDMTMWYQKSCPVFKTTAQHAANRKKVQ